MQEALGISGKFGEATMAARHAYLKRFLPDIGDDNWRTMSKQMASQQIFAEFSRSRRLQLIREEEKAEGTPSPAPYTRCNGRTPRRDQCRTTHGQRGREPAILHSRTLRP